MWYREMSKLSILFVLLLMALSSPTWADEWLDRGDELARWGAYRDADLAYQKSSEPQQTILLRRISLAENLLDEGAVKALARELEKLPGLTQEDRMRISLAHATIAARAFRFKDAQKYNQQAEEEAKGLQGTSSALARYSIASLKALNQMESDGLPTPAQFQATVARVVQPLSGLDPYQKHRPLDYIRAGHWNRIWTIQAILLAVEDVDRRDEWTKLAIDYTTFNYSAALDRSIKASDPEAGSIVVHHLLDLVDNAFHLVEEQRPVLNQARQALQMGDAVLAQQKERLGNPRFIEQERIRARLLRTEAKEHFAAGRLEQAYQAWEQSAELFADLHQPLDQADTYYQAALITTLGGKSSAEQALAYTGKALELSRRLDYFLVRAMSASLLGTIHQAQGQLDLAEKAYWEALRTSEEMVIERGARDQAQIRLLKRHAYVTENLIKVLLEQDKQSEAMEVLHRHQARELLSSLDIGRVQPRQPQVKAALNQVQNSQERTREVSRELVTEKSRPDPSASEIVRLEGELKNSRAAFHQALNQIKASEPEYERLVAIRPTNFSKLQKMLPADSLLVQYFAGDQQLYVFVASRDELAVLEVPVAKADLHREVLELARSIRHQKKDLPQLESLYKHLIVPLKPYLKDRRALVIAPSEFLYYVPFSALKSGDQYLVEQLSVSTVTSLEVFTLFQAKKPQSTEGLLAFGDPDGSLPSAREEVTEVANLFDSPTVFIHQEATKKRLTEVAKSTSIIHFATHGNLNSEDVNASYLLMAGRGSEAQLTVGEIYGLPLEGVRLVTLSGCQTSVGETSSVAEIASLAQAFSVAGSQTMVASLWSVSDRATYQLMVDFYKNLLADKSAGEALRSAQIKMLKSESFSHPYYWAAFEVLGDWR
jgi:CHAT domain-containing protein